MLKVLKLRFLQKFIHFLIEWMARPLRYLIVADPYLLLPLSPPSRPHRHPFISRMHSHSTRANHEYKLHQVTYSSDFRHRLIGFAEAALASGDRGWGSLF